MMTCEVPAINKTGRYPIGEAAKRLGITRQTLRSKTEKGLIKCILQRGTGRKIYTGEALLRYWQINW